MRWKRALSCSSVRLPPSTLRVSTLKPKFPEALCKGRMLTAGAASRRGRGTLHQREYPSHPSGSGTLLAMQSPTVHREWRFARQQGVCVYPVKGSPHLDFASLPHWMRDVHFYDLDHEWAKFVNDLNTRCEKIRVPFMVED